MCFACGVIARTINLALAPVLPVALCPLPSPLYEVLMGYKEAPIAEVRRHHALVVDALLSRFLDRHRYCIFKQLNGEVSAVLPVPSTSRPGAPPLDRIDGLSEHAQDALQWLCDPPPLWCPDLLERTSAPVGHMAAHPGAFEVPEWAGPIVSHGRILLLDDTYVSGARAQSAAAALHLAGATRVLIVPVGRVIRPDLVPEHAEFLRRSRSSRARAYRCARCVVTQREAEAETE